VDPNAPRNPEERGCEDCLCQGALAASDNSFVWQTSPPPDAFALISEDETISNAARAGNLSRQDTVLCRAFAGRFARILHQSLLL
jgi:hypothetical protein